MTENVSHVFAIGEAYPGPTPVSSTIFPIVTERFFAETSGLELSMGLVVYYWTKAQFGRSEARQTIHQTADRMSVEIRKAESHELPAMLGLYRHLHPDDEPLPSAQKLQRVWDEIVSDPKLQLFVAVLDEQLVGSCILAIIPNLSRGARPYGLIENVVTRADHRRKGIGTRLLRHALRVAWENHCYKVMLLTGSKREETLRFYEKAGFKQGIKTGFIATCEANTEQERSREL